MTSFIRFTLSQRVLLNLIFVLLMVIGAWALLSSPVERYPNIHFGKVMIDTFYPGASPQDVEALITGVIEDALKNLDNVEYIRSNSYPERSRILVKFVDDTDYQRGYDELRFKIQAIFKDLPPEADPPQFNELDVNDWFPAISVNILGDRSNRTLTLVAEEMETRLNQIKDLKEIKLVGEMTREFHLVLNPLKMQTLGITFDQASRALSQANVIIPAGEFTTQGGNFMLRVDERFRNRQQALNTIIRTDSDGSFVRISDITSDAYLSHRDPFIISSVNGQDCVSLQLIKTWEGNAINIAEATRKIVAQNQARYQKDGISLLVTQDSTVKIKDSMRVLGINLLLGIILVCFLIWAVMGFRNAALTTIGIPFAFLVTMTITYITGNSINELSLFSFVLVSGIIVDDAIILVENIYRHIQIGKKIETAVVDGTAEVFIPIISATLTTVAAFLPMLIMTGSIGEFFAIIPKAVSYALMASLLECLLILPIHYLDFGPGKNQLDKKGRPYRITCARHQFLVADTPFMAINRKFFNKLLQLSLRFRLSSLVIIFLFFIVALFIAGVSLTGKMNLIHITFFPDDYSIYYVEVDGPIGAPLETTHKLIKNISAEIMKDGTGQASSAQGIAGFFMDEDYNPVWGDHLGHVVVTLPALKKRHFADYPANDILLHLETIRSRLAHFSNSGYTLRIRPEKDGPPAGKDINIRILGQEVTLVQKMATEITSFLRNDPDINKALLDLHDNQGQPGRVLHFKINKERSAEFNLTPAQVSSLAASVLNGRNTGKYRLHDEEIDLKLKIAGNEENGLKNLLAIPIIEHPDGPVRLGDLCIPEFTIEPGSLNRFQGQRAITLTADLRQGSPISSQSVTNKVASYFSTIQAQYPGINLNFAGEQESTKRSYTSLTYAFLIALLIIYLILATQFNSYVQPLIIISAVFFALIGIIYGTFISRSLFTINSFMAIVGVTGVVVNDSLVLIEFINKAFAKGLSRKEAIVEGTNIRLRPIILTTLTTTLGLLPMALGIPEYSLVWGTMAMTFVTGLCTATFLTIIIIPIEWDIVQGVKEKFSSEKRTEQPTDSNQKRYPTIKIELINK